MIIKDSDFSKATQIFDALTHDTNKIQVFQKNIEWAHIMLKGTKIKKRKIIFFLNWKRLKEKSHGFLIEIIAKK